MIKTLEKKYLTFNFHLFTCKSETEYKRVLFLGVYYAHLKIVIMYFLQYLEGL